LEDYSRSKIFWHPLHFSHRFCACTNDSRDDAAIGYGRDYDGTVMTPERWRQIEGLYHSARERGAAVLEGTDPELRREVERLLAQDSDGMLLDRPAAELVGEIAGTDAAARGPRRYAGQTISHYQIQEEIGAGGMGVVYRAFDIKLGRWVALKFLPPHLSHDRELRKRLSDEARAASALDHANIVVIHDIDETPDGDVFIAMALHEGVTLREKIASGLEISEALRIVRQVASGLARAHQQGIIHRDIKPSNVIVTTDGIARIIDFGLAKSSDVTATMATGAKGTPLYMSPEQSSGRAVDSRTDLWSLGAVLYEMLAGEPPFRGDRQLEVTHAIVHYDPPPLRAVRPEVPPAVEAIVSRALEKDTARRYQSAPEMVEDLSKALATLEGPAPGHGFRAVHAVAGAILVLVAAGLSVWFYQRSEKRHWARDQAIPEISRLMNQNKPLAAFRLLQQAQGYLSNDPNLARVAKELTHAVSVGSTPTGATVEIKDYLSPNDAWFPLGTTPLGHVTIPNGYFRWRVTKAGMGEYVSAPITEDFHGFVQQFNFPLDAVAKAPEGMVPMPAGPAFSLVWSLGDLGPYDLPAFDIDRFEVSNRQFQQFVDQGGYQHREYWKEKFLRDGKELDWEQAMGRFRDSTGRPGPAFWEGGHYSAGQAEYPVSGVSWYEASAYAEFAGKSLPVIAQWYLAAPSGIAKYITPQSNFSNAPAPVGQYPGVGPFGTYDMAGNVAEWCRNEAGGGTRYLLGGAWQTQSSEYWEPLPALPFVREKNNGFRCVRNAGPLPPASLAELVPALRNFSDAKPASDEVFRVYKAMYDYDRTPLNAELQSVAQDSADWRKEKVVFNAAYGNERMAAYLFLPAHVRPPYQTVVFFPSARVLDLPNSDTLGDMKFIDYVIQSGRAVIYPVFKGTYERPASLAGPNTAEGRETLIHESKDVGRSIDYLVTRADIDRNRIGYMGISVGAALGVFFAAVEPRLKAVILLDGGFYNEKPLPGADAVDFAPRVKAPTLLISGKFDFVFLAKDSLIRLLGSPPADKKGVTYETGHDVSEQRDNMVREVVAWLDKYLGKVN
jgi:serine/threonine protein kinase/formylglycine-generating enzyme required for sulfatase activity/dienelactone hydrolase